MVAFHGLLYVSETGRRSPNLRAHDPSRALRTYLGSAITLRNSLAALGCDFTLLTNDATRLDTLNREAFNSAIAIREIPFHSPVPKDIPFYSAHHKIDLYRWFATGAGGDYPVLVDLDVVALRPPPQQLLACAQSAIPLIYDLSDHVFPVVEEERVASDLGRLAGCDLPISHWYGGEFIAGPPAFFAALVEHLDLIWDTYCRSFDSLVHQGDEMPTSAALCRMLSDGCVAIDVGPIGGIGRFWSWLPLHPQKPFWWYERCFMLHLPNDKAYLARQAGQQPFEAGSFLHAYRRHLALTWLRSQAYCLAKVALRKRRSYSARREARRLSALRVDNPGALRSGRR